MGWYCLFITVLILTTMLLVSKWKLFSHIWPFATHGLQPTRLLCPWDSPGQNTGVGSLSLLQGIFPTQGSNQVSCTAGRFFTSWATREAQKYWLKLYGVGHLSLLQQIFLTQESNQGLLHCRRILYQLSYQRSALGLRKKGILQVYGFLHMETTTTLQLMTLDTRV